MQTSVVLSSPSAHSSRFGALRSGFAPLRVPSRVAAVLRLSLLGLGLLVWSRPLQAHDAFECWIGAIVRPDSLEINFTLAQGTALRLIDPEAHIRGITLENFPTYRARFEKEGAALCIVTSIRTPLVVRKVEVEFTEENDIAFKVIYPRPPPGRLHFHGAFLKKLGEGYGGIIEINDAAGLNLGWEQLSAENPNFEITVPAAKPAPKKP